VLDFINRMCGQGRDEHEIEETLLNIMIVFKYIEDKDVFQKFYSKNLARRLVNEQSSSDQMEAEMISQLKTACGTEYTNKLQRMITVSARKRANEPGAEQHACACVRRRLCGSVVPAMLLAFWVVDVLCWQALSVMQPPES
jgi:cullin 1